MNKYIGIGVTLILALLAFAVTFGTIKQKADKTEETVEKHAEKIINIRELDVRQSVIMERNTKLLDKLEAKF